MSYVAISDTKYGMDRRRPQTSGVPGTLYTLRNAVITRGGDIERAKKFDERFSLPAGTIGYYAVRQQRYVFGSGTQPAGMPVGVRYQQLAAPGAPTMTEILDAKGFDGKVYAIAAYDDGNIFHFYDGARVTDWDSLAAQAASFESVAERIASLIDAQSAYQATAFGDTIEITAAVPGTAFTITASATDNGAVTNPTATVATTQANAAEVAETRATATVTITGGSAEAGVNRITSATVNGVELLSVPVDFVASNNATANALAVEINNGSYTHGYSAAAAGAVVTISAAVGTGAAPNGYAVVVTTGGNVTATKTDMSGGVAAVAPVAQVSTVAISADNKSSATITVTAGTASAGVNKISEITVDGVALISSAVDWATSNTDTATAVATAINTGTGTHGFTASSSGAVVTVTTASGKGVSLAGFPIVVTAAGDVKVDTTPFKVLFADDLWTVTLDGDDYKTTALASATGTSLYVNNSRIFSTAGSLERYCSINDPTNWTDTAVSSGAGLINVGNDAEGATTLYGAATYVDQTAIFARNTVILYSLPADIATFQKGQVLENTGTIAPRAIVSYGANDVYYLDETGIRSLRTRDVIGQAYASDVGSAIDPFVQAIFAEVGEAVRSKACAVIEPIDGRYMLAIGPYIIVLSYFPSSKITAWSYIDFGENITNMVRIGRSVEIRAGDKIYAYGGVDGTVYPDADEFEVLAETPFISSKDPAGLKELQGYDQAAENTWRVQVLPDPNHPESYIDVGYIRGTTYHLPAVKLPGETSHFALRLTCSAAGYASFSSVAVHTMKGQTE